MLAAILSAASTVNGQATYQVVAAFDVSDFSSSGRYPVAGPIQASDGSFYGTTAFGGPLFGGVVFRLRFPQSIAVTPVKQSNPKGLSHQFTPTGTYSDGSTQNVTDSVTWSSSKTTVATISTGGRALAVSQGTTTIRAAVGSISGSTTLTVTTPALVSISITPANPAILTGATQQFAATGTYTDGSVKTLTTTVKWTSSNTSAAAISSGGLATGAGVGTSTITAAIRSISGMTTLTVQPALVSITITPTNPSIKVGTTQQFTASGTYSDSSTLDPTGSVVWTSSKPGVATISASGLGTAVAKGNTTIKAKSGGVTATTTLTVTP